VRKTVLGSTVLLGLTVVALHEWQLTRALRRATDAQAAMAAEVATLKNQLPASPEETRHQLDRARNDLAQAEARFNAMAARTAELERQLQQLAAQVAEGHSRRTAVLPPSSDPAVATGMAPEFVGVFPKRGRWGPEEAAGPPDTTGAGDISSAWASLRPDAGVEWLRLEYERAVPLAEVRIRETYNPGAVAKVTALLPGGQEIVLWEGVEPPGQAPQDFAVPVTGNVIASSVKVYLDTARVPGWNEIDAVELVGADGSRQWASQVAASNTYAEPLPAAPQ
jgi:hypothetical protein